MNDDMGATVVVVGVDPGGRYTGVVSKKRDVVVTACVIKRASPDPFPDAGYIHEVIDEVCAQFEHADLLAIEGIREPHGRDPEGNRTIMTVAGLIGTGIIFGAVLARWPSAIIVPPGGNGSLPDRAYPPEIRRYQRLGGPSDHARSAWDVATVGQTMSKALRTRGGAR